MAELLSNHLKAVMATEDVLTSDIAFPRDRFFTVQRFEYKCERSCDENGIPFGSTLSVILKASIKATSPDTGKVLFERLKQNSRFPFSFMFNATFDENARLKEYGGGMVVYGYVVNIDEIHNCAPSSEGIGKQMLISFDILVSSITFLGRESNKSLFIIHSCD